MARSAAAFPWGLIALAFFFAPTPSLAQPLPKAADLMKKYIEATGGLKAHVKIKSRTIKGVFTFRKQSGEFERYWQAPNSLYEKATLPSGAILQGGSNGKIAWEMSAGRPAVLTGVRREMLLREANLHADINWQKIFKRAETVRQTKLKDKSAYRVDFTTPAGSVHTRFFDKTTGLLLQTKDLVKTDKGEQKFITRIKKYQKTDGVLFPSHFSKTVHKLRIDYRITSIEHNTPIPVRKFKLPPEIKRMLKKDKKGT